MSSHVFSLLSDQEVVDMKRSRGIMACAECQRRKLKCDRKFPCASCVRRGRQDICPNGDIGPIGRGRRVMRSEPLELRQTINDMGDRIKDLEAAVADAHAKESETPHPLLREDLLGIKLSGELPQACGEPTPSQLEDRFGALAIGDCSTSRYFGPTAGPAAMLAANVRRCGIREQSTSAFTDMTNSFWFTPDLPATWDTAICLEMLLGGLPDEVQAWALCDIYVNGAPWFGTLIMPEELRELLAEVYSPDPTPSQTSPHTLAVVMQADIYFDMGRAALALASVFGSSDLRTVQALVLLGLYYTAGGPRYSSESTWSLVSMAANICQRLCLHRERTYVGVENKLARRQRALFWEVYSLDTYQALSLGRPITIPLAEVDCQFSAGSNQTMDSETQAQVQFSHLKWRFTKEITAPMCHMYTSVVPPSYEDVLDMDKRLRRYTENTNFDRFRGTTFLAHIRSYLIPRFCGDLMLYIHRGSFVQALKDRPHNPLETPFAASFLAAYRGALEIIKSDIRSFACYPEQFSRWWPIWKSLINAAFIVGSIVVKSPESDMAPNAILELFAAVDLVERGALYSILAQGSLPILRRLRNKAVTVYSQFSSVAVPGSLHSSEDVADEQDFELLGGSNAFIDTQSGQQYPKLVSRLVSPLAPKTREQAFPDAYGRINLPAVQFPAYDPIPSQFFTGFTHSGPFGHGVRFLKYD
ncbi:fungal-specific transcription factor domain-containing protein [Mycena sp. CBHHK59/15]|nr:fungal-specific transcription factor domain-containing protein [Mycena sp. CBHHK59/15]